MTNQKSSEDQYYLLAYDEGTAQVTICIRKEIPSTINPADYPCLVSMYWRQENETADGHLTESTMNKMDEMQALLNVLDGEEIGFMMFAVMGNNRKEWIWYTKNEDLFFTSLNDALSNHDPFPIEIEVAPAYDWGAYHKIIEDIKNKQH